MREKKEFLLSKSSRKPTKWVPMLTCRRSDDMKKCSSRTMLDEGRKRVVCVSKCKSTHLSEKQNVSRNEINGGIDSDSTYYFLEGVEGTMKTPMFCSKSDIFYHLSFFSISFFLLVSFICPFIYGNIFEG
jgi:hypothetical protein